MKKIILSILFVCAFIFSFGIFAKEQNTRAYESSPTSYDYLILARDQILSDVFARHIEYTSGYSIAKEYIDGIGVVQVAYNDVIINVNKYKMVYYDSNQVPQTTYGNIDNGITITVKWLNIVNVSGRDYYDCMLQYNVSSLFNSVILPLNFAENTDYTLDKLYFGTEYNNTVHYFDEYNGACSSTTNYVRVRYNAIMKDGYFDTVYQEGIEQGYKAGEWHGYNEGFDDGITATYDGAYQDGYNSGVNGTVTQNWLLTTLNSVFGVLDLEIFPNFKLGYFLFIPIGLGVIFLLIKFVKG